MDDNLFRLLESWFNGADKKFLLIGEKEDKIFEEISQLKLQMADCQATLRAEEKQRINARVDELESKMDKLSSKVDTRNKIFWGILALAGAAIKVMALSRVAKILIPAAHDGMRRPARKKSSVLFSRAEK